MADENAPEEKPADAPPEAPAPVAEAPRPPEDARVRAMELALEHGDHGEARRIAGELARTDDTALRAAGEATLDRLRLDPMVVGVFISSAAVLIALALAYLGPR
jgi:hypothetical protein